MGGGFAELWSQIWPILAATAAMAAAVLLLQEFALAGQVGPAWVRLVLLSVSGALTYGAALLATGSPVIGEGIEVVGWILRRRNADS
jgi:hypothetical protein